MRGFFPRSVILIFPFAISCSQEATFQGELKVPGFSIEIMDCIEAADGGFLFCGRFDMGDYDDFNSLYGFDEEKYPGFVQDEYRGDPTTIVHKISASGDSLWTKLYRQSLQASDICKVSDGYVMTGFIPTDRERMYEGDRTQAVTVLKIDEGGDLMWNKIIPSNYNSTSTDIVQLENDELLVVADHEFPKESEWAINPFSMRLIRLSKDGEVVSDASTESLFTSHYANQAVVTGDNRIFVGGDGGYSGHSFLLMEINTKGDVRQHKEYRWSGSQFSSEWNSCFSIADAGDGLVVSGSAYYHDPDGQRIMKIGYDLDSIWSTFVECESLEESIVACANGDIYFCATSVNDELKISKLSGDGALEWEKEIDGTSLFACGGLLASQNGVLVAGSKHTSGFSDWSGIFFKLDEDGNY